MFGFYDKYALCKKIRKAAKKDGLPENHELRLLADKLEEVIRDKERTPEMIIGAYSDARKAYNEYLESKK